MDLYFDRNKKDKLLNNILKSLALCLKNYHSNYTINKYGKLNKKNNINIHFGIFSKPNTKFRKKLDKKYKFSIIAEQGFINRKKYFSLGVNGIGGLSKRLPKNCPDDRLKMLNIDIKDLKINKSGYILFCAQLPWDSQVKSVNYIEWVYNILNMLKKTKKQILFRYHPLFLKSKKGKKYKFKIPKSIKIDKNKILNNSLKNAYCVISFNSNSLVDSIIQGLPIIACHKMSVVYNLSTKNINGDKYNINNLYIPDKKDIIQTLSNISYMQYNLEELKNNTALSFIKNLI